MLQQDADKVYVRSPSDKPDISTLVTIETDPYKGCEGAHAIAILTEWDEFATYDYAALYNSMQRPAHIFDGRRIINVKVASVP